MWRKRKEMGLCGQDTWLALGRCTGKAQTGPICYTCFIQAHPYIKMYSLWNCALHQHFVVYKIVHRGSSAAQGVHICGSYFIFSFLTFHPHTAENCQVTSPTVRGKLAFGAFGRMVTVSTLKYSSLKNTVLGGKKLRCKLVSFKSHHFRHSDSPSW